MRADPIPDVSITSATDSVSWAGFEAQASLSGPVRLAPAEWSFTTLNEAVEGTGPSAVLTASEVRPNSWCVISRTFARDAVNFRRASGYVVC